MIYNENGNIQNTEYLLDNLLNEAVYYVNVNLNDVTRTAVKVTRYLMDLASKFIDYLQSRKYDKLLKQMDPDKSNFKIKITEEIASYLSADGAGVLFDNFEAACNALKLDNQLSLQELKNILYLKKGRVYEKTDWFRKINLSYYTSTESTISSLQSCLTNTKALSSIRKAYSDIKVINGVIANKPIKSEVMQELKSYCVNAIKSFKNLREAIYSLLSKKNAKIDTDITNNISDEFIKAVENENKSRVRILLKNALLDDKTFKKFDDMSIYVRNHLPDVYVKHNGEELITDRSLWSEEYMNKCLKALINNFSHNRIGHLKNIIRHVYNMEATNDI